jgi:hypothetical protein
VRVTLPAEEVAPDDRGHTYHILKTGEVIATTEPTKVDNAVAEAAITRHPRNREEIAKAMMDFEIRIGNLFAGTALPAAKAWIARAKRYMDERIKPYFDNKQKTDDAFKQLGGPIYQQWAGRIGTKREDIEAVLGGDGNIRELITMFNSFVQNIFIPDLLGGAAGGMNTATPEFASLAQELGVIPQDMEARKQAAVAALTEARARAGQSGPPTNNDIGWQMQAGGAAAAPMAQQSATRTPNAVPMPRNTAGDMSGAAPANTSPLGAPPGGGTPATAAAGAGSTVPSTGDRYAGDRAPTREGDTWWLHGMTVAEFERLGGQLSPREKKLFNEGVYRQKLGELKPTVKDDATWLAAIKAAEEEAQKSVPWAAGVMGYAIKIEAGGPESEQAFMRAVRQLNVPMGAGVSGTTARTMNSAQMFSVDGMAARRVCLGYLLPIQAHSFAEVMQASNPFCGPQYAPKAGSDNYPQGGIEADVKSIPEWTKFDEEFNPKATGSG